VLYDEYKAFKFILYCRQVSAHISNFSKVDVNVQIKFKKKLLV